MSILRLWRLIQMFLLVAIINTNAQLRNITDDSVSVTPEVQFLIIDSTTHSNSDMSSESTMLIENVNDVISTSNSFNETTIQKEQTNNSTADEAVYIIVGRRQIERQSTEFDNNTTATTIMICAPIESNPINVTYRTSSMFTAIITYDCPSMNLSSLEIHNKTPANCSHTEGFSNDDSTSNVKVTCHSIENKAGRNFEFVLSQHERNQFINTTTFIVTLAPLFLNISANITITVDTNLTSALISVSDCEEIAEPDKLMFECDSSNELNGSRSTNCTYICVGVQPGSFYQASLIRLNITQIDNNETFPQEIKTKTYHIDLDKVTNLALHKYLTSNGTAVIHFTLPRGHYDKLRFDCNAQDQC
ncbi:unnamed protein product, partial [Rotaria sp. Silwood1]